MPRRPATITQADIARVLRAIRSAGGGTVEVRPDGTMMIRTSSGDDRPAAGQSEAGNEPLAVL